MAFSWKKGFFRGCWAHSPTWGKYIWGARSAEVEGVCADRLLLKHSKNAVSGTSKLHNKDVWHRCVWLHFVVWPLRVRLFFWEPRGPIIVPGHRKGHEKRGGRIGQRPEGPGHPGRQTSFALTDSHPCFHLRTTWGAFKNIYACLTPGQLISNHWALGLGSSFLQSLLYWLAKIENHWLPCTTPWLLEAPVCIGKEVEAGRPLAWVDSLYLTSLGRLEWLSLRSVASPPLPHSPVAGIQVEGGPSAWYWRASWRVWGELKITDSNKAPWWGSGRLGWSWFYLFQQSLQYLFMMQFLRPVRWALLPFDG